MRRLLALLAVAALAGCGPRLEPLPEAETYPDKATASVVLINRGYRVVPVTGTGSMAPWIPAHPLGRKIIVAYAGLDDAPFSQLKAGNVVVYQRYGQKVIHRIGHQDERGFVAFGINNESSDRDTNGHLGFVTPYNFIGRVSAVTLFPIP